MARTYTPEERYEGGLSGYYDEMQQIPGIPCRILVDGLWAYEEFSHPLWILFQNGYDEENDPWVPLTIEKSPRLPYNVDLKIPNIVFNRLCRFVSANVERLKRIANAEISMLFDDTKEMLSETYTHKSSLVNEMSNLYGDQTGLRGTIWLDVGDRYKKGGHNKRVKFYIRGNKENNVSISVDDDVRAFGDVKEKDYHDVQNAKRWVGYNLPLLHKVMDREISEKEFLDRMVRMNGDDPVKPPLEKFVLYKNVKGTDYSIAIDINTGRFVIVRDDNHQSPVFRESFETLSLIRKVNGGTLVIGQDDECQYVYNLGTLKCSVQPWNEMY